MQNVPLRLGLSVCSLVAIVSVCGAQSTAQVRQLCSQAQPGIGTVRRLPVISEFPPEAVFFITSSLLFLKGLQSRECMAERRHEQLRSRSQRSSLGPRGWLCAVRAN